jgi:iron uptake system EfeUOB component EfeO/EfeM
MPYYQSSHYSRKNSMRPLSLFLVSGLALFGLASCNSTQASAPEATSSAVQTSTASNPSAGFVALKSVTDKTTTAVKAGKLDQAKTEFEQFEASWKTVEDDVKVKSPKTYNLVEEVLDTVYGELKNKQPNETKVLIALQSLSQSIATVAKL